MFDRRGHWIIDENTTPPVQSDTGEKGTGYIPRDYAAYPMNGLKCSRAPSIKAYDLQTIKDAIAEKTAEKSWIKDRCDRVGSKVKNQSRSNYCWIHAPVRGMECLRVVQGGVLLTLSAFYAGANIKNGSNQGGSGVQGVHWLSEHGTCVEAMHPPMNFHPDNTPEHVANAMLHQITVSEDLSPQDKLLIATYVINDQPVSVGIPAWGHEVLITYLVWDDVINFFDPGVDNSWSPSWGDNGRGLLKGAYARFDEAVGIMQMESSTD